MQLLFLITGKSGMGKCQFAVMTGYSDEEMIGKTRDFTGAETDMETVQYMRTNLKGLPFSCEIINYSKGEKYWVKYRGKLYIIGKTKS
jgi:hypothetical protein